jgi:hypothetical protein
VATDFTAGLLSHKMRFSISFMGGGQVGVALVKNY